MYVGGSFSTLEIASSFFERASCISKIVFSIYNVSSAIPLGSILIKFNGNSVDLPSIYLVARGARGLGLWLSKMPGTGLINTQGQFNKLKRGFSEMVWVFLSISLHAHSS